MAGTGTLQRLKKKIGQREIDGMQRNISSLKCPTSDRNQRGTEFEQVISNAG